MSNYEYENVEVKIEDGIAWAIMNRPEKRNAMSPDLHYDMEDAIARLEVDPDVKVVIVKGAGGNFSAGQDLKLFFRANEGNPFERKRAARAAKPGRAGRSHLTPKLRSQQARP